MRAFVQRRELLLGLAALPAASRIAVAETYPSRPVRILVATSAGGGTDLVARFIAQWLTERLNLASGGVGSTGHMSAELFQMMAGIKFTHVPYRG